MYRESSLDRLKKCAKAEEEINTALSNIDGIGYTDLNIDDSDDDLL